MLISPGIKAIIPCCQCRNREGGLGGPVVKNPCFYCKGHQFLPQVSELRSCMLCTVRKRPKHKEDAEDHKISYIK